MRNETFTFKKFTIRHANSSMKVGVDSIVLGSWVEVESARSILDVGTGCGLLALMCAQRNPEATISAVDIDKKSLEEAKYNFGLSPWASRLSAYLKDYNEIKEERFDLIISNPPYFKSGIKPGIHPREQARHQGSLSPKVILRKGVNLITDNGTIGMILPYEQMNEVINESRKLGLSIFRALKIKGRKDLECKRVIMEFKNDKKYNRDAEIRVEELILEQTPNCPTDEFKRLCKDFYLKF
ncbi:MAG: methyltransferase [Muribaculaceae bacterium]|nr:methyltransferase [Muribaculaceae bacterium]